MASTGQLLSDSHANSKIVIIGAGVSGVSCAFHLRRLGFKNVLILEAKDRVGGRMHTNYNCTLFKNEGQHYIEMGCQWIHGAEGNPIYKIAHSNDLIDESAPSYLEAIFNFKNEFSEEESEAILAMWEHLDEQIENIPKDTRFDLSLGDFIKKEFENYLKDHLEREQLLKSVFIFYSLAQCELNGCTNLSSISAPLLNQYEHCKGNETTELKRGYRSVLDIFLKDIPDDSIVLKKEVTKIDWTDLMKQAGDNVCKEFKCDTNSNQTESSPKIKIYCADGEIYEADHVVSTLSLGYMKKNFDSLFVPSLPEKKVTAIKSVGFGTINKIYLEFEEPFWEPTTIYHVCWNDCLYETLKAELRCLKDFDWIYFINRFAYVSGQPHMLCAWITGEGAITMEKIPEKEVMDLCMVLMKKVVGKQLPNPQRIFRSTWNSDPQTFGSYSFLSTESNEESNLDLAEPVLSTLFQPERPVLQFAGEATHPTYYSTVHGAYETGLREAQRLYDHYRYTCGCHKALQCDSK